MLQNIILTVYYITFAMFFAVSRCRAGGKVERGDRADSARRVDRQRGGGRGGRLAHDGARLKSEYRVDGERLGRSGRRRAQHVGLGAIPAGRSHATRVTLEDSCGCGRGRRCCCCCCCRRPVAGCTVQLLSVIEVMLVMVVMVLLLLLLVLLVMVTVLLLVQFEQLRQSSVVLLEQRILQHHHSRYLQTAVCCGQTATSDDRDAPSTVYDYDRPIFLYNR